MYVGRIVAVGRTPQGQMAVIYRVSSRSFPNREAKVLGETVAIVPKPGFETDVQRNPYIAYHCLRVVGDVAVASNGAHTDPIAEKIAAGMSIRDALTLSLLALDYEKDAYNTPRIAAVVRAGAETGFLAVVRPDCLHVHELALNAGECFYVATYEHNEVRPEQREQFAVCSAAEAARHIVEFGRFAELEKPITSAAALETSDGFELATFSVSPQ